MKIIFEYKGTMVKITKNLSESFEFSRPIKTVRDALAFLNERYNHELSQHIDEDINVILKRDDNPGILIKDEGIDEELGEVNTITFFYPFRGG